MPCIAAAPVLAGLVLASLTLSLTAQPARAGGVDREIHVPDGWEGAYDFGYAPVVRVGDMVIVSGIPAGGERAYEEKIRRMYQRAAELLEAAGATIDDVVELTTFHREPRDSPAFHAEFDRYMPIHREFFGVHRPAWTAVGTTPLLSPTAPVEMRVIAVIGSGKASRVVFENPPEPKPGTAAGGAEGTK
jgi:enamine deaminase RidA (YjgF/YER057c/UK114 family)